MGFGTSVHGLLARDGFFGNFIGNPGPILGHKAEQGQASDPVGHDRTGVPFPQSALVYFQFVFAGITPILMLGSVLGRVNFKAWIPFVVLWITFVYTRRRVPDLGRRLLRASTARSTTPAVT